jgi:5-methyltetrahydrofolate--homocysteine methyltransferase
MTTRETLDAIAARRILLLDGAMGSMIQNLKLGEDDFRGRDGRFASHKKDLRGCNDLLCLTQPRIIGSIHEAYLAAGADIIKTCSFNATAVSLGDYGIADLAYEISRASARLAREAADKFAAPDKPRFVAGSMGPTAKCAGISPDMNDPAKRAVAWDELEAAYYDNARGLLDGGADILLIETVVDSLNAKAAIAAVMRLREERCPNPLSAPPLMISATVSGASGRLLTGQTLEAFCISVFHGEPWSVGLNCSFGAERLKAHVREIAGFAPCLVSAHPNAGLPNRLGEYDETPESMGAHIEEYLREGLVNIVGGCCGSTPEHIRVIAGMIPRYPPRKPPAPRRGTFLAGLESLLVDRDRGFIDVGERTNVAGSRKFLKLIKEDDYNEAAETARDMAERGASILDVCMDDPLLDAPAAMVRFLNMALSYPDIARLPIMADSSRWEIIETALKCLPGKGLVNSISLKEGEEIFLHRARRARLYGAAVVVMLFDEQGQAADYERKIEVARRSYALLTRNGFPAEDIVFDPNVLTVATGMAEHDRYALDFIRACAWIREHCPGVQISGGVSNLSFSFRGNDPVREAMHGVFLKHAIDSGLSMAIVNPAALVPYDEIDPVLRQAAEEVILCLPGGSGTASGPAERLLALALNIAGGSKKKAKPDRPGEETLKPPEDKAEAALSWRSASPEDRIVYAMVKGLDDFIGQDVLELRPKYGRSLNIVEGPLMKGMREVGERFGEGKMFLPQVIRSARVMKKAVAALEPFMNQEKAVDLAGKSGENSGNGGNQTAGEYTGSAKILLATVKGDVHDIGKNILGVVLGCNGYAILDLGIMVPAAAIIDTALKEGAAVIGLSGLITPSLDEMILTAREMEKRGLKIPLMIGGAATSLAHTALRIAPEYSGPVVYVPDASRAAAVVRSLLSGTERHKFLEELEHSYREAAKRHESIQTHIELLSLEAARKNRLTVDWQTARLPLPSAPEPEELQNYPIASLVPLIDWTGFLRAWDMDASTPSPPSPGEDPRAGEKDRASREEAEKKLLEDARLLLDRVIAEDMLKLRGIAEFFPACSDGDDVLLYAPAGTEPVARFSFLRNQEKRRTGGPNPCLADFIPPSSPDRAGRIGLFALSAGFGLKEGEAAFRSRRDDYGAILLGSLANSLAEAFTEELHRRSCPENSRGIRPAFGYPVCPDHHDKETVFNLLRVRERCGLELTESAMIFPAASTCGMFFPFPASYYFGIGPVGDDQLQDWAARKGITAAEARRRIGRI